MDWQIIFDLISTLLEKCQQKEGRETTKERMRDFGKGNGELAVRLHLRAKGLRRAEINDVIDQLKSASETASDDDFDSLLNAVGQTE